MPKSKTVPTAAQVSLRDSILKAYNTTEAAATSAVASVGYERAKAYEHTFASNTHDDITAALATPEGVKSTESMATILSDARAAYKLRLSDFATYKTLFLGDTRQGWQPRIKAIRETLRAKAAQQADAKLIAGFVAAQMDAAKGDVQEAFKLAAPQVANARAEAKAKADAAEKAKEQRKSDPVIAAEYFAERCVADDDRGLDWLAIYAKRLAEVAAKLVVERARAQKAKANAEAQAAKAKAAAKAATAEAKAA